MAENDTALSVGRNGAQVAKARPERWTPAKERKFLDHLAVSANVKASLAEVGMSAAGLYKYRRRSAHFRSAWDEALAGGYARLEAVLLDRALNGKRVTVERGGTLVETVEYSDTLALNLLVQHRRAVADYRAAMAVHGPREDVAVLRTRIVEQIMTIVDALPDRDPALGTEVVSP